MKFVLRYWTRRSASTIALQCTQHPRAICAAARRLRHEAAERDWTIYGEAFLRLNSRGDTTLHLPVRLGNDRPCFPLATGRIDYGPVVAAYEVPVGETGRVVKAMTDYITGHTGMTGPVEYHFDPSVGRTEGLVVVPVTEHPVDKLAYISILDAVTG